MNAPRSLTSPPTELPPYDPTEERRKFFERLILATALPGVAGAVNASGFLAVGTYTSHVTGLVGRFGDELAQGRAPSAWPALGLVGLFLVGAITATGLVERARRLAKARYVAPLLLECGVLASFALWASAHPGSAGFALTGLLCFAMGLQNALVTKISGAVIRTTHLTGITTDIGIELVRCYGWIRDELRRETSLHNSYAVGRSLLGGGEWKKLRLHLVVFGSFLSGAVLGPELFLAFGQWAMIAPCLTLVLLAAFDLALGIRGTAEPRASVPEATVIPLGAARR